MRVLFNLILLLLVIPEAHGSSQILAPTEPLHINVDCARFRGSDDVSTQLEVYYAFPQRGLTLSADSAGFAGSADITLMVSLADSLIFGDRWLVPCRMTDTAAVPQGMSLVGNYTVQLSAGDYVVKLLARDRLNLHRADSVLFRVPIRPYKTDRQVISDIEFAGSIHQGSRESPFYKNTLEVVPNIGGIYHESQKCFYYAEAYNLLAGGDRDDFVLRTTVSDAVGKEIMSRERTKKRAGESSVIVDNIGVDKMRSGTYTLTLGILDSSHRIIASTGKKFYVYSPSLGVDSSLLTSASELPIEAYLTMEETELDREFKWSGYEANDAEKRQFPQLKGLDAKRKFMSTFWRHRPAGHREEYLARVAYTNNNFQMLGREGYRTDRGRVYIVYGPPDDIERHPYETETRPYEVWQYNNIQGGVIFVFVLRNSGGDHELVHSTHRNEIRDDNWDRVGVTR